MSTPAGSTSKRLEGKVAVITGGASGIGESTARLFVSHGAKVVIADIQDNLGQSICQELGSENALFSHCDVTKDEDIQNAVDSAVSKFGKLDIMFNNAGITDKLKPSVLEIDNENFQKVLNVNIFGSFLGAKHAARVMIPQRKGCILFTSSACSITTAGTLHAYKASKHALVGLTQNLCAELGKYGIRVNSIAPYGIATPLMQNTFGMEENEIETWMGKAANMKGVTLKPEDIALAALYLASDEAKFVSGLNLLVDGGCTKINPAIAMAAAQAS
ncbi:short chain aldehyde dehydrogenase 1-like isoform X3 [Tasmannia lanceolata]|uniref:short chain aldehyde dehydrogenase 1-like isoform X3 n=1 Tax=Tasmannia lanceolata TaxID=3420 RepID=UPI0040633DF4